MTIAHALPWAWTLAALTFGVAQLLLLGYAAHRMLTLWRWQRRARPAPTPPLADAELPRVTVQLPVFNECAVVERLIDAVAALDYPRERLDVQVLDDSTDDTTARARERVRYWRGHGLAIELLHRETRHGYKAGALAAGLARARGELLAVFDADFVPSPDVLRRLVPRCADPGVGMVQARWTHLNRERSALTGAQAVLLDAHFALEHEARMAARLFFNFNGTAGLWRRACVEDAGGWTHDTLTEDLDLSYRAQLRGWRFVAAGDVEVPAELPSDALALRSQQRRWAKGSIQTARKLLPALLRAALPARVKLEAVLHLTANLAYPMLLLSALLLPLVVAVPARLSPALAALVEALSIVVGVAPVVVFLAVGQAAVGRPAHRRTRDVANALLVGAGLTVNNSLAVLEAFGPRLGDWERTPKTGELGAVARGAAYHGRADLTPALELALALVFTVLAAILARLGHPRSAPFPLLLASGLGYLGALSLKGTFAGLRRPPAGRPHLVLGARTAAR